MTDDQQPQAANDAREKPSRRRDWDGVAAIIAAFVGLLALLVSGYTAYIQHQQVRAQVWPYLEAGNDDGNQSINVYNKGVGPAIVKSAQVFIDGKPQTDWAHVLTSLGLPPHDYAQSTLNPDVISPGEEVRVIRIKAEDRWKAFRSAAVERMTMDICFCSTLDECWMYSDQHPVGYKSTAQLVQPTDRCPRLPDAEVFNN
jgi:hypothetical protein